MLASTPLPALAQPSDTEPPVLELSPMDKGLIGEDQVFEITASDNEQLQSVFLVYRIGDSADYQRLVMERTGQSDVFSATVPGSEIGQQTRVVQYYIEATDVVGNRRLEGFSFNPLVRNLVDQSEFDQAMAQAESRDGTFLSNLSTRQKILYGALTVLTVGALIAASDDGGAAVSQGTPVVIVAQPPID